MSVSWTNELELALIECYHAEPILWDPQHKQHKEKMKVHDAWMRIQELMNIEVTELKKKKENLMSSYRTYKKKVKDSLKSGSSSDETYKPIWFAFDAIDAFMGERDSCKKTTNTEEESDIDNNAVKGQQAVQSSNEQIKLPHTIRRRNKPPELNDAGKVVQDALATLKTTINKKESQSDQDDVYDLYGKMLSKKIKTLPEDDRLPFMYEIDGLFLRHQQNSRNRYNRLYNSPAQSTFTAYRNPSTSRSIYSEHQSPPPSTELYGRPSTSRSTYSEQQSPPPSTELYGRPSTSRSIYSEHPSPPPSTELYGRPSTSHSTYSEHQSPPPSTELYGRPSTSRSTYSEHQSPPPSTELYERPSTSRSTYSEHQSQTPSTALYGRPSTSHSIYSEHTTSPITHNPDYKTCTGSRVMVTSDKVVEPPVIHIRDYNRNTGSKVMVTSNKVIKSRGIHIPQNSRNTGSKLMVTSNKVIKSRGIHIPDYSTNTHSRAMVTSDEEESQVIHIPENSRNTGSKLMVTSNDVESPATYYLANTETEESQTEFGNIINKAFHLA